MKKITILISLTLHLLLIAQNIQFRTFPDMESKLGTHFPIENFQDKNGKNFNSNYLKGKNTLINLWFTNCSPCLTEIPTLNNLKKSVTGANFIAITPDPFDKVNSFLTKRNYDFLQITDAKDQLQSYLTIQRFPMSLIIDKQGNIKEIIGLITEDKMNLIKNLLNE